MLTSASVTLPFSSITKLIPTVTEPGVVNSRCAGQYNFFSSHLIHAASPPLKFDSLFTEEVSVCGLYASERVFFSSDHVFPSSRRAADHRIAEVQRAERDEAGFSSKWGKVRLTGMR